MKNKIYILLAVLVFSIMTVSAVPDVYQEDADILDCVNTECAPEVDDGNWDSCTTEMN